MAEGLLLVVWSSIGLWVVGWVGLWVQSFYSVMGRVGLGQSFGELGWVGLKKLDPRTTLIRLHVSYTVWSGKVQVDSRHTAND